MQIHMGTDSYLVVFMDMVQDTKDKARKSLVLALEERRREEKPVPAFVAEPSARRAPSMPPRPPVAPADLDADLEDFIARYPKTLEYLAK